MLKKLKVMKNEKGMTLIELLAVIVIIAIVAAIAIPAIGNIIENSRYNAAKSDALNVLSAANLHYTDTNSTTAVTVTTLIADGYLDDAGYFAGAAALTDTFSISTAKALTATIEVNGKDVVFTAADIALINSDKAKGSKIADNYVVGTTK